MFQLFVHHEFRFGYITSQGSSARQEVKGWERVNKNILFWILHAVLPCKRSMQTKENDLFCCSMLRKDVGATLNTKIHLNSQNAANRNVKHHRRAHCLFPNYARYDLCVARQWAFYVKWSQSSIYEVLNTDLTLIPGATNVLSSGQPRVESRF